MEFQGIYQNLRKKHRFLGGSMQRNGKFQEGHGKFDWKSRGFNFKKIDILNRGGTIFFWKSPMNVAKSAQSP